jgi:hypothetical protein
MRQVRSFPKQYAGKYAEVLDGRVWLIEDVDLDDLGAEDFKQLQQRVTAAAWSRGLKARTMINAKGLYIQATPREDS